MHNAVAQNGARAYSPRQEAGALELAVTTWGYWLLLGLLAATFGATFWVCSQKRTSFGITRQSARQEEA